MIKRPLFLLTGPALAAVVLFACDDSSSGGGGGTFTFDGGQFDAPVLPPADSSLPPDAPVDAAPLPVTVIVTDNLRPLADVRILWHDATGAVVGEAKTGADGKATRADAPAMASALVDGVSGPQVITWTGVAAGDVLRANTRRQGAAPTATYDVSLNQTPIVGSMVYRMRAGTCDTGGPAPDVAAQYEIPLYGPCAMSPGAVLAISYDEANFVNGFSFAKGLLPVTDGGTVAVSTGAWSAPTTVNLNVANFPDGGSANAIFSQIAGSLVFPNETFTNLGSDGTAAFSVANGFADALQYGFLASTGFGPYLARRVVGKRGPFATTVTVDHNDLLPALTSGEVDTTDPARPTVTWTSQTTLATTDGGTVNLRFHKFNADATNGWTIIVPPTAGTSGSVKLPALPADADAWAIGPSEAGATGVETPLVIFAESDVLPGYTELRSVAALAIPGANDSVDQISEALLPVAGKLRLTSVKKAQ